MRIIFIAAVAALAAAAITNPVSTAIIAGAMLAGNAVVTKKGK